jgi:hypothetical protein
MAGDADREANRATTTSVREAYQLMAKQWRRLADETDPGT